MKMATLLIHLMQIKQKNKEAIIMASIADVKKFEEMIAAVEKFVKEVSEASNEMSAGGNQCVEQCDNDVPSTKANAKLSECVKKLNESLEEAQKVRNGLQRELEHLQTILKTADDFDS